MPKFFGLRKVGIFKHEDSFLIITLGDIKEYTSNFEGENVSSNQQKKLGFFFFFKEGNLLFR